MPPLVIGGVVIGVGELMAGTAMVGSAVGSGVVVGNAIVSHNQASEGDKSQEAKDGAKQELDTEEDARQGCAGCDEKPPEEEPEPKYKKNLSPKERQGLNELFGKGPDGAQDLINRINAGENVTLPDGVTNE